MHWWQIFMGHRSRLPPRHCDTGDSDSCGLYFLLISLIFRRNALNASADFFNHRVSGVKKSFSELFFSVQEKLREFRVFSLSSLEGFSEPVTQNPEL
jgi:hypothetical protein